MRQRGTDLDTPPPGPPAVAGFRRRWTAAFVIGELVGFVPPAVTGATLGTLGVPDPVLVAGLTAAGVVEGAVLGAAQRTVLERWAAAVDGRAWVVATATAAAFAWFVGMAGGALMGADIAPPGLLLVVLAPAWTAALLSMGYLQWRVLRAALPRSARWVWVTAGAWLVGVMIPVAALSLVPDGWPGWAQAVVGVASAVAMGATVGALTGRTLEGLLARAAPSGRTAAQPPSTSAR